MIMSKKTATITWITYHNLGTFLQAYALQKIIYSLGYDNCIISDRRFIKEKSFLWRVVVNIYHFICGYNVFVKGRRKESRLYKRFINDYLLIDDSWIDYSDLDSKYDIFICGSDQIWSPSLEYNPFYYLGFTNKKKIAYAPSIGQRFCSLERIRKMKLNLDKFSFLSIREETGKRLLLKFIKRDIQVVVDPTLLLSSKEWGELIFNSRCSKESYVLCYMLSYNEAYIHCIKNFSKRKQVLIKWVITDKRYLKHADIPLFVGPIEFLNEIKNATYFFTDSFHGSIFAIHFEKRFWTFKRFEENEKNNQNSRINDLFLMLGILDYIIDGKDFVEKMNLPCIDYNIVKRKIYEEREKSLNYLVNALKS